jgi:hypothetical protein
VPTASHLAMGRQREQLLSFSRAKTMLKLLSRQVVALTNLMPHKTAKGRAQEALKLTNSCKILRTLKLKQSSRLRELN